MRHMRTDHWRQSSGPDAGGAKHDAEDGDGSVRSRIRTTVYQCEDKG